jgi:hypothetical protein
LTKGQKGEASLKRRAWAWIGIGKRKAADALKPAQPVGARGVRRTTTGSA